MVFRVQVQHEKRFADLPALYEQMKRFDFTSALLFPMRTMPDEQYEVNVQLDSQRTSTKSAKITITYDNDLEDNGAEPNEPKHPRSQEVRNNPLNAANPSSKSPNSQKRREEFLRNVAAGITHSEASVLDIAVEYIGNKNQNAEYIATIAYADSPIHPKTRLLFFASALDTKPSAQPHQICMTVNGKFPNTPEMNFKHALEYDATSNVDVNLAFGVGKCEHGSEITLKGKWEQSEERKQYIRNHAVSKQCYKQMEQGNYQLPACQLATLSANKLDQVQINIEYDHIPAAAVIATQKLYDIARYAGYSYLFEDYNHSGKQGRVELEARFAPNLKSANVSILAPTVQARFENIRLNKMDRTTFAVHPSMSLMERLDKRISAMMSVSLIKIN